MVLVEVAASRKQRPLKTETGDGGGGEATPEENVGRRNMIPESLDGGEIMNREREQGGPLVMGLEVRAGLGSS